MLIAEGGVARLADYGMMGIIIDPTLVEPSNTTIPKPGIVRYMAPELLNPSQFNLESGSPSKESDVYSLAMTIYEVGSSQAACGRH